MTSIPEPACLVILDAANVRRKMIEYRIQTDTFAETLSTPDFNMANMLHTDAEWLLLHPLFDAAGNAQPATERLPQRPEPLGNDPAAKHITLYNMKRTIADTALAHMNAFKALIIKSHGPDIASETSDHIRGHLDASISDIHSYVMRTYGTLDSDDILFFQQDLRRWDLEAPFNSNIARMRKNFAALADINMLQSDVERVAVLIAATAHISSISGIVHNYRTINPTIAQQNFNALAAYIQVQIPVATAQARANATLAATANSAALEKANATLASDLAAARAEIAALTLGAANSTAAKTATTRAPVPAAKTGKPTAAEKAKWTPGRLYCWQHGFHRHTGIQCHNLKKSPDWKREALDPGPLNGEYGSRAGE